MASATTARDFMVTKVVTLRPDTHVFDATSQLQQQRLTGAPVVDDQGNYLGIFSERCCLRILTETASQLNGEFAGLPLPVASQFMVTQPLTLSTHMDVFAAINHLLDHDHCGALVVNDEGQYVGVFSQRTAMRVLVHAAYDQLPSTDVWTSMDCDADRVVGPATDLLTCAEKFLRNSWRILPVLEAGEILGQVGRGEVLRAEHHLATHFRNSVGELSNAPRSMAKTDIEALIPSTVETWMDTSASIITENTDLFAIAHIFRDTPYRRLPVLRDGKLLGLVTRRHILQAASKLLVPDGLPTRSSQVFLSAIATPEDSPIM